MSGLSGTLALFAALLAAAPEAPSGDAVLRRVDENLGSDNKVTRARMTVRGRGGSRSVEMQSWIRGMSELFTEYLAPPRDRGSKMLKLGDQLWTYYPSSDRIILIAGHMLRQSVMGSDLSYEDMMEDPTLWGSQAAPASGEESQLGRPCWVLDLKAKRADAAYPRRRIWVDNRRR